MGPVATPTFSPAAGTYTTSQSVSISSTTPGVTIYYTTDGTVPNKNSSAYTGPISVKTSETLQALAVADGIRTSAVATAKYVINSPVTISVSSFAFARNAIQNSLTQTVATVTNSGSTSVTLTPTISGDSSYTLKTASSQSCGAQLAASATCSLIVQYLPTVAGTQTGSINVTSSGTISGSGTITLTGTSIAAPNGTVTATANPLVATYTVSPQFAASVTVQFGMDTTYGYTTSVATTSTSGTGVSLLVAGMRANTTYHMRAMITYADGNATPNADQTFMTGALPANLAALNLTATTTPGMTPQPGIELMNPVNVGPYQPYAIDLQGNVIWYYAWTDYVATHQIDGLKQLPNGDFIAVIGVLSSQPLIAPTDPTSILIREFDLAGNTVKQLTMADLNGTLAAAGYSVVLADFHHDITVLPNGHWLILANTLKSVNGINVLGDVVVDVDTNMNPRFVWNEFDHFDTARQPMGYPDWTHSNAILYSPDDGNFLVSIRHQDWVVKVNYKDGAGDGSVIWKLGNQGDFTLQNGISPTDWQYAQHYPSYVGTATAGVFRLTLMDNGDNRIVSGTTGVCGVNGNQACYSTVPIFQIDERALTATIQGRVTLPPAQYSSFAGNAEVLANDNLEFDLCGIVTGSEIYEVSGNHSVVWSLIAHGNSEYRAFRIPSLYPNVQWP